MTRYSMFVPIISNIEKTTPGFPSQWKGDTENGGKLYIRYRYGNLSIRFDWYNPVKNGKSIIDKSFKKGGYLETKELLRNIETLGKLRIGFDYNNQKYYNKYEWEDIKLSEFGEDRLVCTNKECNFERENKELDEIEKINARIIPPECIVCGHEIDMISVNDYI